MTRFLFVLIAIVVVFAVIPAAAQSEDAACTPAAYSDMLSDAAVALAGADNAADTDALLDFLMTDLRNLRAECNGLSFSDHATALAGPIELPAGTCTAELDSAWESWLQGFQPVISMASNVHHLNSLTAQFLQTGAEPFGVSECDQVRADYFQLTTLFYSLFTSFQIQLLRLETDESPDILPLGDTASELFQSISGRIAMPALQVVADYFDQGSDISR